MGDHAPAGPIRRPLDDALQAEIGRLELLVSKCWLLLGVIGIVGGSLVYAVMGLVMGAWCAVTSAALMPWFMVDVWHRQRGGPARWLQVGNVIVESAIPWAFMLVIAYTQGPAYALGSWVPPMAFAAVIVASVARLRVSPPVILAASSAALFVTLYFAVVRGLLPADRAHEPLLSPQMQISRTIGFLLGGVLAAVISGGLRRAIGKADVVARERDLFGKYRVLSRIASGGMGTVYEALYCPEGGFERRVAIKRIHPHLARTSDFVESFRREAELSARLAHPNIVQVLDFGRVGDGYFLALEYVDGMTLESLMTRLREAELEVAPRLVAHIGREILAGLAYSHAGARDADGSLMRVVHRDLSPANVLVSRNGEVKITDFGVARALRDAAAANTKTVVGHAAYMAPEQARALPIDERCDLFALGVTLWELLCSRRLFDRGAEGATLMALVSDSIPTPSEVASVHGRWDGFLERALQRDPDKRFPSARVMVRELDTLPDARTGSLPASGQEELAALVLRALELPDHGSGNEQAATTQLPTRVWSAADPVA